jgi:SAM-dependent methyltransferase
MKTECLFCQNNNLTDLIRKFPGKDADDTVSFSITRDKRDFFGQIKQCQACGMVWKFPRPHNVSAYYEKMVDDFYVEESNARRKTFSNIIQAIEKFKKGGKLLDVGCATGFFLDVARKRGWEVCGVEFSRWAVDFARRVFGLNVICSDIKQVDLPPSSFDAVTLIDTAEHLASPSDTLKHLHKLLKENGVLYILTPDIGSLAAKICGGRWWGMCESHLNYFSRDTLCALLSKSGFEILAVSWRGRCFRVKHWLQRSIEYYKDPPYLAFTLRALQNIVNRLPVINESEIYLNTFDEIEIIAVKK